MRYRPRILQRHSGSGLERNDGRRSPHVRLRPRTRVPASGCARALGRYLMRTGRGARVPAWGGSRRNAPRTRNRHGRQGAHEGDALPAADERRLSSEGFLSLTFQPIRGPRSAGVTNVSLYETAEGAKRSLAHELRPDVIRAAGPVANVRFFSVRAFPARAAGPRPCPASRRAAASGTSSGCRVGACTSSGTRAPVPSSARCRGARGRSMNARATGARARSRPGHRGARACERHPAVGPGDGGADHRRGAAQRPVISRYARVGRRGAAGAAL